MDGYFTLFVFVVAIAASVGCVLLLVGYIETIPAAVAHGWRWALIAIALPLAGPIWFAGRHWKDCSKAGKQLVAGCVLVAIAVALLYGAGPLFVKRMGAAA